MKRDVLDYFIAQQKQYNDMLKVLEQVNKEIEEGKVSDEQRVAFEQYFSTVKCNYDRIAYIVHLMKLPPKWIQNLKKSKLLKEQEEFIKKLEKATQADVELENKEALDNMNTLLDDVKGSNEEEVKNDCIEREN